MKTRIGLVIVLFGLLVAGGYYVVTRPSAPSDASSSQTATATARLGDLQLRLSGVGVIVADQIPLAFTIPGEVTELDLELGDKVQAGQILARLDARQAELDLKEAQLNWDQLTAPQLVADTEQTTLQLSEDLLAAQEALDFLRAGPAEWYYAAMLDQAIAEYEEVRQDYLRAVRLSQTDPKTYKPKVAQLERLLERARERVEAAQADLAWVKNYTPDPQSLRQAEAQVALVGARLLAQQAYLEVLQTQAEPAIDDGRAWNDALVTYSKAMLMVEKAQLVVNQSALIAPMNGTVTQILFSPGERISASETVITLSVMDVPQVKFYIEETDLAQLSLGDPIEIRLDAYPEEEFYGAVTRIDPALVQVSGSQVIQVWGKITSPQADLLLPGMNLEVEVIAAEANDVLLIPQQALHQSVDGTFYVEVLQPDGSFVITPVVPGLRDLTNVQILSDLQAGLQVKTAVH